MSSRTYDWDMLGRVIRHEVDRYPGGQPQFLEDAKVSPSSLNKAIAHTLGADSKMYDRIEHGLHLPDRTFQFILLREHDELLRIGVRPALVQWIKDGGADPIPTRKRTVGRKNA